MRDNNEIYYSAGKIPDAILPFLRRIAIKATTGRDYSFESPYLKDQIDEFPWAAHNIEKPDIKTFSRWYMSACKAGLGLDGKRKKIDRQIEVSAVIKTSIIADAEAIVLKIQDSFLGSPVFYKLTKKYPQVPTHILAGILVSRRKLTPSKNKGKIYIYRTLPNSSPNIIKVGFTEGDPKKRMNDATRNTKTESPQMIGWVYGDKSDETHISNSWRDYNDDGCGKEVFNLPDADMPVNLLKGKISDNGGKLYV